MNSDFPKSPREELEARLTALLLGELSEEEAAALRRAIEADVQLGRLYDRLKQTIDLVRATAGFETSRPWFAIGGIDTERLPEVLAAGASRIVVVRAITAAEDPEAAARDLRSRLP